MLYRRRSTCRRSVCPGACRTWGNSPSPRAPSPVGAGVGNLAVGPRVHRFRAGIKATFQTAGIGAVLGGLVGAKVGWEARGAAVAASNAKDAVAAQLEKVQKAVK